MNILIGLAFVVILGSLAAAVYYMLHGGEKTKATNNRMVRALTVRIALSIAVFICILLAWKLGYIQPTGIRSGA